jgi:YD repeat-containing protein
MQHPLRAKSLLVFMLVYSCLFSCQQFIDIIQPQPPRPVEQTCRVVRKTDPNGYITEYTYDDKGRLVKTFYNTDLPNAIGDITTTFSYNQANQLINQTMSTDVAGFNRSFEYDANGRVSKVINDEVFDSSPDYITVYTYSGNTVKVKTTTTDVNGQINNFESTYFFENENLVKGRFNEGSIDVREITYTYGTALNKISAVEKQIAFLGGSPFVSKNLVSKGVDGQGKVTTFMWELNTQGYPVKRSLTGEDFGPLVDTFEYNCTNK